MSTGAWIVIVIILLVLGGGAVIQYNLTQHRRRHLSGGYRPHKSWPEGHALSSLGSERLPAPDLRPERTLSSLSSASSEGDILSAEQTDIPRNRIQWGDNDENSTISRQSVLPAGGIRWGEMQDQDNNTGSDLDIRNSGVVDAVQCPICRLEVQKHASNVVMCSDTCDTYYHTACLNLHSDQCPICQNEIQAISNVDTNDLKCPVCYRSVPLDADETIICTGTCDTRYHSGCLDDYGGKCLICQTQLV